MKKTILKRMMLFCSVFLFALFPLFFASEDVFAADDDVTTYTVLVLDTSGQAGFKYNNQLIYTADTAIGYVKQAANTFLLDVLKAKGDHYVAVVSFTENAAVVSDFTNDLNTLREKISALSSSNKDLRNIAAGLDTADALLRNIPDQDNIKKSAVLFTTGMTNTGDYTYSGKYDSGTVGSSWKNISTGVKLYAYANTAVNSANTLKQNAELYVVGLFDTMDGMPTQGRAVAEFFKMTARDLASVDESFYEIYDPSQLDLGFEDVADSVTDILTFPFNDVRYSDWYYRSVKYVWKHNLMQGTSPGKFSPEIATTRAMIVMVLYNFEGNPTVRTENTFKDVAVGTWYNDAVTWAQNNGIVLGFSPERFGPEVNITREQMAAILYRYADYKNFDTSPRAVLYHYRDWNKISKYAFDYMAWANAKGYIQGTSPSTLSPRNEATRAQVAAIFHRFFRDVL
ncbi:MAG: S-layer homology domain-containing protein [Bacillota bacterium]|jgi:hypothetical protein